MSFLTKLPRERYDPRALDEFRIGRDFDPGTGRAMAWLSQLAYETDEPGKIADILGSWSLRLVGNGIVSREITTVLPLARTQCVVAAGRGATIVAFAGTDPLVLANWITDFDINLTGTGTARGFDTAAEDVWPTLRDLLAARAPAEANIYVTGHSLGGALAALIAQRISAAGVGEVDAVYTFGMPRPGSPALAEAYNPLLGARTFRLVHGEDLVPSVAPSLLGFRHLGRFLHCERGGRFDRAALSAGTDSDEPSFRRGISKELAALLRQPLAGTFSFAARIKSAWALLRGRGPDHMRSDPAGIIIETLPPRLRDHMPDRYIGGFRAGE